MVTESRNVSDQRSMRLRSGTDTCQARQRILTEPVSPAEMPWDNPFPTFNTKKKHRREHGSLDESMHNMNLGNHNDSRPNTSQGHGRRDDGRPHTSHGQGRTDNLPSPMLPPNHDPMARLHKDPPSRSGMMAASAESPPPELQRPGIAPYASNSNGPSQSYSGEYGSSFAGQDPRSHSFPQNFEPTISRAATGPVESQSPYNQEHFGEPVQRSWSHGDTSNGNYQNNQPSFQQPINQGPPFQGHDRRPDHPGMPNGHRSSHDRPQMQVQTSFNSSQPLPNHNEHSYRSPTGEYLPHMDNRITRNPRSLTSAGSGPPMDNFDFGLPANAGMPPNGMNNAGLPRNPRPGPHQAYSNESPLQERNYEQKPYPQERPGGNFPPRGASRPQDAFSYGNGDQNPPKSQQRGPYQDPGRPGTSHYPPGRNRMDHRNMTGGTNWDSGGRNNGPRGPDASNQAPYGYQQEPTHPQPIPGQSNYNSGHQAGISPPVNPPRPPPVRYHNSQASNESAPLQLPRNPDALPAHPAPVRPGLTGNSGSKCKIRSNFRTELQARPKPSTRSSTYILRAASSHIQ